MEFDLKISNLHTKSDLITRGFDNYCNMFSNCIRRVPGMKCGTCALKEKVPNLEEFIDLPPEEKIEEVQLMLILT